MRRPTSVTELEVGLAATRHKAMETVVCLDFVATEESSEVGRVGKVGPDRGDPARAFERCRYWWRTYIGEDDGYG